MMDRSQVHTTHHLKEFFMLFPKRQTKTFGNEFDSQKHLVEAWVSKMEMDWRLTVPLSEENKCLFGKF
jgi:hypothetical protein